MSRNFPHEVRRSGFQFRDNFRYEQENEMKAKEKSGLKEITSEWSRQKMEEKLSESNNVLKYHKYENLTKHCCLDALQVEALH
jgi:hypothetical protein